MISLYLGENEYKFPNSWEELTQDQYLAMLPLFQQYSEETISVSDVKALWFTDIAGLKGMRVPKKKRNLHAENIYRMSREFSFMFQIEYPKGSLDNISPDLRSKLRKTPPEDLEQTPEVRYLSRQDYQYKIDACWCKNLVPDITVGKLKLKGYTTDLKGNMLQTSMVASQFNLVTELLSQYEASQNKLYLRMIVACLYAPEGESFNGDLIADRADQLIGIDEIVLDAILLNLQAFLTFIKLKTKWGLLWKHTPSKKGGVSIGANESLFNLSERNHGDFEKIDQMPLIKFLDLMLKDLYDAVKTMKDHEMDVVEIASKAGLSIHQVKQILG